MTQLSSDSELSEIEAPIGYMVDTGVTPVFYQSNVPGERTKVEGTREKRIMKIINGRLVPNLFSLEVEGFAFTEHHTQVNNFYDDLELSNVYESEVEKLITEKIDATRVVVFDHTRRSSSQELREKHNARDPAGTAHTDYTDWSAIQRVKDILPNESENLLSKRFAIVNIWRSINGNIQEWPLALCDSRSINDAFLHTVERRAYNRVGQTRHASYDPKNLWYYFPKMQPHEIILIKNYDSILAVSYTHLRAHETDS